MKKPSTLREAAVRTLETRWAPKKNGDIYYGHIEEVIEMMGGKDIKLSDIDQGWADQVRQGLFKKARRSSTANKKISALRSVLGMTDVQVSLPGLPVQIQSGARALSDAELEKVDHWFRFVCTSHKVKAYYAVMRDTGARGHEEMSSITPDDINWEKKTVTIRSKKGSLGDVMERSVYLTDVSERALSWVVALEQDQMFTHGMNYMFRKAFNDMRNEIFPDDSQIKPYSLRHTFAMRLSRAGVSIHVIAKIMGHKSIQTTLNYLHVTDNDKDDILSALCTSKTQSN